jgi:2'-5' RNA ligase
MRDRVTDARWTSVENQHITLKFLGSTRPDLVNQIGSVIEAVGGRATPEQVRLAGFGAFPSARRARVVWAGIDDPAGLLARAARDLHEGLEPLGFEPEKRELTPHLTLARLRTPRNLVGDIGHLPETDFAPFPVESLDLFLSRLSPRGAKYELMKPFPLSAQRLHN